MVSMKVINLVLKIVNDILYFLNNFYIILFLTILIVFYNFLLYLIKDRKSIKRFKAFKDPDTVSINDLKSLPLVNIVIPAWKEGEIFKGLLNSIQNLSYPNLEIIVNAGGSEETLEIANSFKKYDNFVILHQKGGADRPSLGKVRALNKCLDYISKGIVYFIDADSYLTDEILLRMIHPIINYNEDIVIGATKPLKSQENIGLVKYLLIDRTLMLGYKFTRYASENKITGQNLCLKFDVLKSIGKFTENKKFSTDRSMGYDLFSKGYRAYTLFDHRHRIHVDYSSTFKEYLNQKTIWMENRLIFILKSKKLKGLKFLLIFSVSLYLFIFPFLLFINFGLFIIGLLLLLLIYLKKIRKYIYFKKFVEKEYFSSNSAKYFITLFYYIYMDALIIIRIPFHFVFFIKNLRHKKLKV